MSNWTIEYDNDTGPGDESFDEWWTVTDGRREFTCKNEDDANFLMRLLMKASEADLPNN